MDVIFAALFTGILRAAVGGWAFMIAVGVAHAEWVHNLPTVGFGTSIILSAFFALALVPGLSSSSR